MADSAARLLMDEPLRRRVASKAHQTASQRFSDERIVPLYERFYEAILRGEPQGYTPV